MPKKALKAKAKKAAAKAAAKKEVKKAEKKMAKISINDSDADNVEEMEIEVHSFF
jgi:hypothetical protein